MEQQLVPGHGRRAARLRGAGPGSGRPAAVRSSCCGRRCCLGPAVACCWGAVVWRRPWRARCCQIQALAGRQMFDTFADVIRLRRICRQNGVGAFKDSTMRLRDSAITAVDCALCKTHEVDDVSPEAACPWPGGGHLIREAVFLVPECACGQDQREPACSKGAAPWRARPCHLGPCCCSVRGAP